MMPELGKVFFSFLHSVDDVTLKSVHHTKGRQVSILKSEQRLTKYQRTVLNYFNIKRWV